MRSGRCSKYRRFKVANKHLLMLFALRRLPYEVGGVLDLNPQGLQRMVVFPGRRDEAVDPHQFHAFPVLFHTHPDNPAFVSESDRADAIQKRWRTDHKLDWDLIIQPPSAGDLFSFVTFVIHRVSEAMLIAANEGLYCLQMNRAGYERISWETNRDPLSMLNSAETCAHEYDKATDILLKDLQKWTASKISAKEPLSDVTIQIIQKHIASEVTRFINDSFDVVRCRFIPWTKITDFHITVYMKYNKNVALSSFNRKNFSVTNQSPSGKI